MEAAGSPELMQMLEGLFERRRNNFLEDHELQNQPAITWQCWPSDTLVIDITNKNMQEAIRQGGRPNSSDGWWHGFMMDRQPALSFDGLTSAAGRDAAGWATELHVDGYLAAGVWTFPEMGANSPSPRPGIAAFYTEAFLDFTHLAARVYEAAGYESKLHLTATMHQADKLALLASHERVLAPAPKRRMLRWPIVTVATTGLAGAGAVMAAQLMRIYGRSVGT